MQTDNLESGKGWKKEFLCLRKWDVGLRYAYETQNKGIKNERRRPSPMWESGAPCRVGKRWKNLKNTEVWCSILWWLRCLKVDFLWSLLHTGFGDLNTSHHQTRTRSEFHDWVDLGGKRTAGVKEWDNPRLIRFRRSRVRGVTTRTFSQEFSEDGKEGTDLYITHGMGR